MAENRPQFLFQCSLGKDSSAPAGPAAAQQHSGSILNEYSFIKKKIAMNDLCGMVTCDMLSQLIVHTHNITETRFIMLITRCKSGCKIAVINYLLGNAEYSLE